MTSYDLAEESEQLARLGSNAYTLTVRQNPERGKAFSAPREKDRKPIDPPPIIQLRIDDPQDPAANYLQSPYFFMCCNLCDADLNRPGQLSAALQGEDATTASQAALAGTLVSSLHRLKDIDNTDRGFFVFPDLTVRIEGQFRLRFSLFEFLKNANKVIYIKSVFSDSFTVYPSRAFPGMAESTFLSRSFGDQGVKIRIRKEPRTLGSKRGAPVETPTSETSQPSQPQPQAFNPQRAGYPGMAMQSQQPSQTAEYGSEVREVAAGYDEPPSKRRRVETDFERRATYMEGQRSTQRAFTHQRDPIGQYREPTPTQRQSIYAQQPASAQSSEFSLPGHQRNPSSSASSAFESPRAEYPSYTYSSQTPLYSQVRDQNYQFAHRHQLQMQSQPPVPLERQLPSSIPSQQHLGAYNRVDETIQQQQQQQEQAYANARYPRQVQPYQGPQPTYPSHQQPLQRTLPPPTHPAPATNPAPLGSNVQAPQYTTTNGTGSDTYAAVSGAQPYQNYMFPSRESR